MSQVALNLTGQGKLVPLEIDIERDKILSNILLSPLVLGMAQKLTLQKPLKFWPENCLSGYHCWY